MWLILVLLYDDGSDEPTQVFICSDDRLLHFQNQTATADSAAAPASSSDPASGAVPVPSADATDDHNTHTAARDRVYESVIREQEKLQQEEEPFVPADVLLEVKHSQMCSSVALDIT